MQFYFDKGFQGLHGERVDDVAQVVGGDSLIKKKEIAEPSLNFVVLFRQVRIVLFALVGFFHFYLLLVGRQLHLDTEDLRFDFQKILSVVLCYLYFRRHPGIVSVH